MRQELLSLPKTLADDVARNLVMVAKLLDEDPEQAYGYSRVALRLASRVAAVREAAGFASYGVAKYAEALAEFRAARRMTGSSDLWPVMADCERGMGRPERALAMAGEPEVQKLDRAGQVEMRLVAAGARRDMGQTEAAVVTLQSSELASSAIHPWTARLRYAYADALLAVERTDEAREWFAKALEADQGGTTDASDRLAELDGVEFVDALEDDGDPAGAGQEPTAADADHAGRTAADDVAGDAADATSDAVSDEAGDQVADDAVEDAADGVVDDAVDGSVADEAADEPVSGAADGGAEAGAADDADAAAGEAADGPVADAGEQGAGDGAADGSAAPAAGDEQVAPADREGERGRPDAG
ncbi:hypothetical protein AAHZ94_32930 [Streptomyces sp. HSW2009]|uniref:hypothetical protein n=1 Tax=Streptomyces sp. HSW2009 TaxID=3142890 RepID=UPI0032ED2630